MKIKLDDNWMIKTDSLNFILYKKVKNPKLKTKWKNKEYYRTLTDVFDAYRLRALRGSRVSTFKGVEKKLDEVKKVISGTVKKIAEQGKETEK